MSKEQPAEVAEVEEVAEVAEVAEVEEVEEVEGADKIEETDEVDEFDEFFKTIQLNELCATASHHRGGIPCTVRNHTIGGTSIIHQYDTWYLLLIKHRIQHCFRISFSGWDCLDRTDSSSTQLLPARTNFDFVCRDYEIPQKE
jgi:hypothetical protein